jgi:uncharacterized delta-60 repeat protein
VALVIALANPAAAPPGDLDTTFDGDGKATTDFAGGTDEAHAVAIQADGRIMAAGFAVVSGTFDFALSRYNADGSLDTTFSPDGLVTTDFAGGVDQARGVAIQGDGKIVAAGLAFSGTNDFALARYNTDGSLDTTFSGDGKVTTDFGATDDVARAVAIQGDGRIVAAGLAGVSGTTGFALARYNTDGSLDTTFSGDGKVTTDFTGDLDEAYAVAIQGDGKIVAAGVADVTGHVADFALSRYNADGSLDTTFDGDGKVTTDFASDSDLARGVAIQGDGRIVAAGLAAVSGPTGFALARYNTDGSLDTTFSGDGKVTTDFGGTDDLARAVAIQGDGKIVAAGPVEFSAGNDFALARYNADGSLDTTFSGDGKVTTDFGGGGDQASAVAIQGDGRIVAAGRVVSGGTHDFAVARYTVSDTQSPSVPTNLQATAVNSSRIDLSWTASTDNVGVTGYDIFRDGAFLANVGNVTTYSDTTAAPSTTYTYRVRARDGADNVSTLSDPATATTPAPPDTEVPTIPTGLSATAMSPTRVDLSWTASTDNVGVTGYEIFRNGSLLDSVGSVTAYSDTTVSPSTTYSYQVRARDAAGNPSGLSNTATVTTPAGPPGPVVTPAPTLTPVPKQVRLRTSDRMVEAGEQVTLTARVLPCGNHAGERVILKGGGKERVKRSNVNCMVRWRLRLEETTRFRAISPQQDADHLKGVSKRVKVTPGPLSSHRRGLE